MSNVNLDRTRGAATDVVELRLDPTPERVEPAPSLPVSFGWVATGNLLYAVCQWAILVVLAKVGDAAMVGEYALALAITAPVVLLLGANLRSLVATDAQGSYSFNEYLAFRLLTTAAALVVIVALTVTVPRSSFGVLLAVGVAKAIEAISDLFTGGFQQHEAMSVASRSLVLRGTAGLLGLTATVLAGGSLALGICTLAAAWALVLLLHDRPTLERLVHGSLRPRFDAARLHSLLGLAAPLGLVAMLVSLSLNIPRYVLQQSHGTESVGFYAGVASFLVTGMLLMNALGAAVAPRLARFHASNDLSAFRRLVRGLTATAVALGIASALVALVVGPVLLRTFFSPRYEPFADDLAWLMLAAPAAYVASLLSYAATAARSLRSQGVLLVLVCGVMGVSGLMWIPAFGVRGAVWTTGIGLTTQALGILGICFGSGGKGNHA